MSGLMVVTALASSLVALAICCVVYFQSRRSALWSGAAIAVVALAASLAVAYPDVRPSDPALASYLENVYLVVAAVGASFFASAVTLGLGVSPSSFRSGRPPSDLQILRLIHRIYLDKFGQFDCSVLEPDRSSKIYVPIDCKLVARMLGVDGDIVFGRLYYHLDKKHGYISSDGARVHLFALAVGADRHVVNFPLLSAVLAELEQSSLRFNSSLFASGLAVFISVLALFR